MCRNALQWSSGRKGCLIGTKACETSYGPRAEEKEQVFCVCVVPPPQVKIIENKEEQSMLVAADRHKEGGE